jgi:DNA sulfur modification protein DndD
MEIQSKAINAWRSKLEVVNRADSALEYVLEKLIEERKKTIEEAASTMMKTLAAREVNWGRIVIDENYTVELYDKNGEAIPRSSLSDGQKELLALSFIAGLKSATDRVAPVVVDYLLGRLDVEYQDNVAAEMQTFGDQVVYLVLDSELNKERRETLKKQANEWFFIKKDARTGVSEITTGGSA